MSQYIHSMIFVNWVIFLIIFNKVNAVKQEMFRTIADALQKFVTFRWNNLCKALCEAL